MKRYSGECYDCGGTVRCDEGGLACYHIPYRGRGECPGSREAVKRETMKEDNSGEPVWGLPDMDRPKLQPKPKPKIVRNALVALRPAAAPAPPIPADPAPPPPPPQEPGEEVMPSTHPAFVGSRGVPVNMDARKEALIDVAVKYNDKHDKWPTKALLTGLLGSHPDTVGKVIDALEEDDAVLVEDDGQVVIIVPEDEEVEAKPAKKANGKANGAHKKDEKPVFENLDVEDEAERFGDDPLYKLMTEERSTLEREVKELSEQLEPKKIKLDRVRRSLKAYVAER